MTVFFIFHSTRGSSVVCVDVFRVVHTDFREIADVVAYCFANKQKINIDSKNALRNEFSFRFNPY